MFWPLVLLILIASLCGIGAPEPDEPLEGSTWGLLSI